jgi:hypothetical protein
LWLTQLKSACRNLPRECRLCWWNISAFTTETLQPAGVSISRLAFADDIASCTCQLQQQHGRGSGMARHNLVKKTCNAQFFLGAFYGALSLFIATALGKEHMERLRKVSGVPTAFIRALRPVKAMYNRVQECTALPSAAASCSTAPSSMVPTITAT